MALTARERATEARKREPGEEPKEHETTTPAALGGGGGSGRTTPKTFTAQELKRAEALTEEAQRKAFGSVIEPRKFTAVQRRRAQSLREGAQVKEFGEILSAQRAVITTRGLKGRAVTRLDPEFARRLDVFQEQLITQRKAKQKAIQRKRLLRPEQVFLLPGAEAIKTAQQTIAIGEKPETRFERL
ncbi:unnamed protein product, partial [marine sediment metagenome]